MSGAVERVEQGYAPVEVCLRRAQALALLDALISPEWEYRYYSFNAAWSDRRKMASVRNGAGDHTFMLFGEGACCFKDIVHEWPEAPQGAEIRREVQKEPLSLIQEVLTEPAFHMDEASILGWYDVQRQVWQEVRLVDLPEDHRLSGLLLTGTPRDYVAWAEEYYERDVPLSVVQQLFAGEGLSEVLVQAINPDLSLEEVQEAVHEIGYPLAES